MELEPEVITAASTYFGLVLSAPRCTAEPGDCAEFLKDRHRRILTAMEGAATRAAGSDGADGAETAVSTVATEASDCASAPTTADGVANDGRYEVILLDAFTAEGLAPSTRKNATLDAAAGCLATQQVLVDLVGKVHEVNRARQAGLALARPVDEALTHAR